MFEEFMRAVRQLEGPVTVSIDMPLDEKGHFDRRCPHSECAAEFKVLFADWRDKVSESYNRKLWMN